MLKISGSEHCESYISTYSTVCESARPRAQDSENCRVSLVPKLYYVDEHLSRAAVWNETHWSSTHRKQQK